MGPYEHIAKFAHELRNTLRNALSGFGFVQGDTKQPQRENKKSQPHTSAMLNFAIRQPVQPAAVGGATGVVPHPVLIGPQHDGMTDAHVAQDANRNVDLKAKVKADAQRATTKANDAPENQPELNNTLTNANDLKYNHTPTKGHTFRPSPF